MKKLINSIRSKASSLATRTVTAVTNVKAEGYVDSGVKILIAGDDGEGGTMDLTDEQVRKYTEMFRTPENITPQEVQNDIWCAVIGFN